MPEHFLLNINITGTFTVDLLRQGLNFWLDKIQIKANINFVGYNQIFQQLLNPLSEFNQHNHQVNCILIRLEDIINNEKKDTYDDLKNAIIANLSINETNKLIVVFCPPSEHFLEINDQLDVSYQFENKIAKLQDEFSNLIAIQSLIFKDFYDLSDYYEFLGETIGHIPYNENFFAIAATLIIRKIYALKKSPVKAIVVDCDNTIWQGIVGEDGAQNVKFGEAELQLQKFLIDQSENGILICLCSKNVEQDVWDVFAHNKNMLLKREHISFYKINWEPKSKNIRLLSKEINIGLDSFVFIDDNPVECEEVKANLPSVLTIQKMPGIDNISYIKNGWVFDQIKVTDEDRKRASMYQTEAHRTSLKRQFKSYKDFINELNICIEIAEITSKELSRVSQLTFRTNQFNLTTIRRTEDELKQFIANSANKLFFVSLNDKFGDYGIIGAMFVVFNENEVYVDTFLLSCRALGKGVEHNMISFLGNLASQYQKSNIIVPFTKSNKNLVAENFLSHNFASNLKETNETKEYILPYEVASAFRFDPNNNINVFEEQTSTNIETEATENIIERNRLYEDIIKNYTNTYSIVKGIYGKTEIKTNSIKTFSDIEQELLILWKSALNNSSIGINDNFFDVGGESILIPQIIIQFHRSFNISISIVDFFQYPTVKSLADFIKSKVEPTEVKQKKGPIIQRTPVSLNNPIAIIGLSGRFPGAKNIEEFWEIIKNGQETISHFTRDELVAKGVSEELLNNPNYIYANGIIDEGDEFDASFFGFTPLEATCMDPQHRVFLETAYEALENSGYISDDYEGSIGVFAGSGPDNYLLKNLSRQPETIKKLGELQIVTNNGKDYLTTYVSYKLNLKGPSLNIQTACSTSLVAVHNACLNLLTYQCDIALAGGVFIQVPRGKGYMYKEGEIFSKTGSCRPFDKDADGMLFGEGAGIVVLKRYEEAVRDNDTIWAVIKGTSINNDGTLKVGFMAPSVEGQSKVITKAQEIGGVHPDDISYIETHGTGTHLGDPIEIAALKKAFESKTSLKNFCAIGSVKANIGHLDAAAGVAGLIKTVLALKNKKIPPSINFVSPNPELKIEGSPFFVNTKLKEWESNNKSRIAAVSSFGVGGTNAHCIVEEGEDIIKNISNKKFHPIFLSAKTKSALKNQQKNLVNHLQKHDVDISDIAYTLLVGRKHYKYRSALFCQDSLDITKQLGNSAEGIQLLDNPKIVYVFTGQGSQYKNMAKDLYSTFETFKATIDEGHAYLKNNFSLNLLDILYSDQTLNQINNTENAQVALFTIQFALFKLLKEFGIEPSILIGHSIGEITAACVSGLLSFTDALHLVAVRGKLMQAQQKGSMLSIQLPSDEVKKILPECLDLALINAPNVTVVSGIFEDIENFQKIIKENFPEISTSILATSHAFHSRMMNPALDLFKNELRDIKFGNIQIPIISNVTGTWANDNIMGNIGYWANHIRSTVNFKDGIEELAKNKNTIFLEVGPGTSISSMLSQFKNNNQKLVTISTMRHPKKDNSDTNVFLDALTQIWVVGGEQYFSNYYSLEKRSRIPLPTYPFERKKFWIEPKNALDFNLEQNVFIDYQSDELNIEVTSNNETGSANHFSRPDLLNPYVAPGNEIEITIVNIWQELFGIEGIGVQDDFFDLGGHSLLASQIINRINEIFSVKLPVETIFKQTKIIDIEKLIATIDFSKSPTITYPKIEGNEHLPISHEQMRLWILSLFDKNPAYNIPFTYKFIGDINLEILIQSIQLVIDRNSILNSNIVTEGIQPFLKINKVDKHNIQYIDLSKNNSEECQQEIFSILKKTVQKLFDIENEPLYRIYLIKEKASEIIFHMTVNHLVFDGWSWGIFLKELYNSYYNLSNNSQITLPETQCKYYEYAAWQHEQPDNGMYEASLSYWKEKLKNHPIELNFPFDYERKPKSSGLGARIYFSISEDLNRTLKILSKNLGTTEFTTYISAFAALLYKYSGDRDLCIGISAANRPNAILEKIVGFFVNTLVLRFNIEDSESFYDFITKNKELVIEALQHQDLPFDKLVETLRPPRIVNINPIFQVMFSWLSAPKIPNELEVFKTERFPIHEGVSPMDITVYITEDEGKIEGEIEYNTDIFTKERIEKLTKNYLNLLQFISNNTRSNISDFAMLK